MSGQSYSVLRTAIQQAVAAKFATGKHDWAYVQDFDDTTAIYSCNEQTFQIAYKTDANGNVTLDGDPTPVRPVTTYVPSEAKDDRGVPFESRGILRPPGMPHVEVRSEPLTYERHGPHSYFRDIVLADPSQVADADAAARLQRHRQEMAVEERRYEARARRELSDGGFEFRVNPNTTQGQGGYFALPLWMNQRFATQHRAARVLADMVPTFPLPHGAHSINLPRMTAGNAAQPVADVSADAEGTVTDASVTAVVTTISGMGDVALQLLEQSPSGAHLDWAWFKDLTEAYDAQLEAQLLFGSGVGENIAGIASYVVPSTNQVVTSTTPSTATSGGKLWTAIAKAGSLIGDNRSLPPQVFLMRTARWMWLGQQGDKQARPLITPGDAPDGVDGKPVDGMMPVGSAYGPPVYLDDAIPTTLNVTTTGTPPLTGGTQDAVIACRPSDLILFEDRPVTSVWFEVLSGTLQARIQFRNFAAALTGRYPTGIATVTGALLAKDTGF